MTSLAPTVTRGRSPFAAAFLSFLFPGLGQAYAGRGSRGIAFATLPLLVFSLLIGLLVNKPSRDTLLAQLTSPRVLLVVLVINGLLLLYRAVAVLDAFRTAASGPKLPERLAGTSPRPVRRSLGTRLLSLLGLLAILAVLVAGHFAVARVNLAVYGFLSGISDAGGPRLPPRVPPAAPGATSSSPSPASSPTSSTPTAQPTAPPKPWNGTERLNILLIGSDARPIEGHFFTDTLIVASIDPTTRQVAMFSLPRDTIRVPLPPAWPAASLYGGVFPDKINSLWINAVNHATLFPGDDTQRGYVALKGALGELYGLDIKYYVEVDMTGFRRLVDTVGGVVIDVQVPVSDDHYPRPGDREAQNLYIPPGIQHMDGERALAYARARHKTNDFDRSQRQQRVILSLREQTDLGMLLQPDRLDSLSAALQETIHTDIPPDINPQLISLAQTVDLTNLRSLVFTPPVFQTECETCYSLTPNVERIRSAVKQAFQYDPKLEAERARLEAEGARVWVVNGSGRAGQAGETASYLAFRGVNATVPQANGGRADRTNYPTTVITVYNGAATRLRQTVAFLQETFGVQAVEKTDAKVKIDIQVTTGRATPVLAPPQ